MTDTQHTDTHDQNDDIVLEVEGVTKRFPGVLANDDVNLALRRGEILALLGENGAGKSTLMNIIYGLYHQDEGSVHLKGKEVRFTSPREAIGSLNENQAKVFEQISEVIEENREQIKVASDAFGAAAPQLEIAMTRFAKITEDVSEGRGTLGKLS